MERGLTRDQIIVEKIMEKNGTILWCCWIEQIATIKCHRGHEFDLSYEEIEGNYWCNSCMYWEPEDSDWNQSEMSLWAATKRSMCNIIIKDRGGIILSERSNRMTIRCRLNHTFDMLINSIYHGEWCSRCGKSEPKESKGEMLVREYLMGRRIDFIQEYQALWAGRKRYDFSFWYEGRWYILEFDGEQHFKWSRYFGGDLKERQKIDIEKTRMAMQQGAIFIRISYNTMKNISVFLDGALNNTKQQLIVSDMNMYAWLNCGLSM